MKKTVYCVFLACLVFTGTVYAKDTLTIGILDFPPFYNVVDGKEPSGYLTDYLKDLAVRAGFDANVIGYPAKRLFKTLREGSVQLSAGIKRPDAYGNDVIFSSKKITDISVKLFTRMDTIPFTSKEELRGKRILGIAGYSYGGLLDFINDPANKIILDTSNDHILMFKKLLAYRADYLLDYARPSEIALKELGYPDLKSHTLITVDVYLILSKKTPHAYTVMEQLEKANAEWIKEAGEIR